MVKNLNWNLKSCWSVRAPRGRRAHGLSVYLLEHEVTVGSDLTGIEVVARFVHALPETSCGFSTVCRGGLVSLILRRNRTSTKRIGAKVSPKCTFHFKKISISPQSRATTISGSSSPVAAPLTLSVPTNGIVPSVPTPEIVKEDKSTVPAVPSPDAILPDQSCTDANVGSYSSDLPADANASQTTAWLRAARFHAFESTFLSFSASDILRLSRDDLIQICGLADGIRLYNALHAKAPAPKLSLYFSIEGNSSLWRVVYLESLTSASLTNKLLRTLSLPQERLHSILLLGPQGIHVLVNNELVANMKDESMYFVETIKDSNSDRYKLLLKPSSR